jgi:hypothetical protein
MEYNVPWILCQYTSLVKRGAQKESPEMSNRCPRCGAELLPGELCRDRFDLCLAKEFEHPGTYGAVHHLTVACYMLQHNEYAREAWLATRAGLAQVIEQEITPAELRRQNRPKMDNRSRPWKIARGEKISAVDSIIWTRTIADVRLDTPEEYCLDVKLWASSFLEDTEALVQKIEQEPLVGQAMLRREE